MHGREHLVGIKPLGRGQALYILRYARSFSRRWPRILVLTARALLRRFGQSARLNT
jgi:hypothetical protein